MLQVACTVSSQAPKQHAVTACCFDLNTKPPDGVPFSTKQSQEKCLTKPQYFLYFQGQEESLITP